MIFDQKFQAALTKATEVAEAAKPPARRPNPRVGHIRAGGATAQLLAVLASNPRRPFSYREIHARMTEQKSLNWSLRYAENQGWIKTARDPRSERYQRYFITTLGLKAFQ